MLDIVRDSAFGQVARLFSKAASLAHLEERIDFALPSTYDASLQPINSKPIEYNDKAGRPEFESAEDNIYTEPDALELHPFTSRVERCNTRPSADDDERDEIVPARTREGVILVSWYTDDDPDNPQKWSSGKKLFVTMQICVYTFSVYIGSSLYVASELKVMDRFPVSETDATLGLALYVLAYGIGPMLWSPLSEIPAIGRNVVYMATYLVFVAMCIATSLAGSFASLLILRFLLGFFGSPCLATGGASLGDMYAPTKMPYVIALWAGSATLGPALGPVVSGFAVSAKNWRWSSWELVWLSGPILLLLFFFLPETSHDAILLRRARLLRERTHRTNLRSQSEMTFANKTISQIATEALLRPWQINLLDPAVLFTTLYTALIYGIFYSFFESFPLVYPGIYGFNLGQTGLPFLVVLVALAICIPAYSAYFWYHAEPIMRKTPGFGPPEARLVPGLYTSFLIPVGCFMFGKWKIRMRLSPQVAQH